MTRHGTCPVNHRGRWSALKCGLGINRRYRQRKAAKVIADGPHVYVNGTRQSNIDRIEMTIDRPNPTVTSTETVKVEPDFPMVLAGTVVPTRCNPQSEHCGNTSCSEHQT